MLLRVLTVGLFAALGACSEPEKPVNPFPEQDRASFMAVCSADAAFCTCSWDKITREFTAEEWASAKATLDTTGHPDPRIVVISSHCREESRH
jgi:hypothetical protein